MAMRTDDIGGDMQGKKIYPVTEYSKSQRIALLINIIHFDNPKSNRDGAEKDTQAMLNLFHDLGYEVVDYQDLTAQEIDEALINFSKHPKLFNTDSVFVVLMSHGDLGTICGSDLKDFETDKIYERLNTKNCPALMNKPKVIIIQACRGGNDGVVKVSGSRQVMATEYIKSSSRNVSKGGIVHVEKDFISFYSSTRYTTSYRNPGNGSCFIYYICDVISTYCHTDDIEELFKKVMQRFEDSPSGHKQMPTKERVTLTKDFYLLPDQSPTSPSAAPTPQVQRLHELIEKLPDNCRRAAETLWKACQQPDRKEELNQLFKCLEMKQPHTVCADAVKIYTYCTAEAFGADKDVLYQVNLSQQLLVESTDLQECNTVIVFCPINSCVRSDVEAAMAKAPGDKDIILVVMHHTRKTDYSTSGTEWSQIFPNVILHVDILFHETERGLLRCQKNVKAICQIQQELQKHNDISEPTNTVGEQGHLAPPQSQTSLVPKMQGSNNSDRHCLIL